MARKKLDGLSLYWGMTSESPKLQSAWYHRNCGLGPEKLEGRYLVLQLKHPVLRVDFLIAERMLQIQWGMGREVNQKSDGCICRSWQDGAKTRFCPKMLIRFFHGSVLSYVQ